jgi:amino-acid N-acetyltransferase
VRDISVTYRVATSADYKAIKDLLISCLLPPDDLEQVMADSGSLFIVAEDDSRIIGSIGLQKHGSDALIRSFAVDIYYRGSEVTAKLMKELERHARTLKIETGYLLTTTITNFLLRHGFERYDRAAVPDAIAKTEQFASVCPDSAACLARKLI